MYVASTSPITKETIGVDVVRGVPFFSANIYPPAAFTGMTVFREDYQE